MWRSPKPVSCQPDDAGRRTVPSDCFYKEVKGIIMTLPAKGVCWPLVFCFSPDFQAFSGEKRVSEGTFPPPPPPSSHVLQRSGPWLGSLFCPLVFPVAGGVPTCCSLVPPLVPRRASPEWLMAKQGAVADASARVHGAYATWETTPPGGNGRPGALFLKPH